MYKDFDKITFYIEIMITTIIVLLFIADISTKYGRDSEHWIWTKIDEYH